MSAQSPMAATSSARPWGRDGAVPCALPHPSSRTISEEDQGGSVRRGLLRCPQLIEEVLVPPPVGMLDPTLCSRRSDLSQCQSNSGRALPHRTVETVGRKTERRALQVKSISGLLRYIPGYRQPGELVSYCHRGFEPPFTCPRNVSGSSTRAEPKGRS